MSAFSPAESAACRTLVELALSEDLGLSGDRTSSALIPERQLGSALMVARANGVVAGLPAAALVVQLVHPALGFTQLVEDGTRVTNGTRLALVTGPMRWILIAERTLLNFVQRLSGIATQTRRFVDAVAGLPVRILDTRKTTPGWRLLEKYAVRAGGGMNHRLGLHDGILIKDNHLAALTSERDPIAVAISRARAVAPSSPVEIEVDSVAQFDRALACGADLILLDNMRPDLMRECVRRRGVCGKSATLEASGGITLANVREVAETGVDRISIGALTHSATALDLALDYCDSRFAPNPASTTLENRDP